MIPFSRGKRMLELSQKATEQKRRKQEFTLHGEQNIEERPHAATPTLDISTSPLQDAPLSNSSWKGYPKCRHITVEKTPPKCTWKLPSDRILMFTGNI